MSKELFTAKSDYFSWQSPIKTFINEQDRQAEILKQAFNPLDGLQSPIKTFINEQDRQAEILKQAFNPLDGLQNALNCYHIRTLGDITPPITNPAYLTENKTFFATPAPKRKPVIIDHEPISPTDTKQTDTQNKVPAVSVTHLPPVEAEPRKSRKQLQKENIALEAKLETQQMLIEMLVNAQYTRLNEPLTKADQTINDQQKEIKILQAEILRLTALVEAPAPPKDRQEMTGKTVGAVARLIYVLLKMNGIENDTKKGKGKANDIIQMASRLHLKTELSREFIADWLKHAKEAEYKQQG